MAYHKKSHPLYGVQIGVMKDIIESLTEKQIEWLAKITPDGVKLSNVIKAIVVDAYFEENEE
tara:strand:+ start:194 stop:379 length:186 start_codon:yes stop_codon:yes gene_type:complete